MVNNDQSVSIDLIPECIRDIEQFVDTVCDQLFINDTYYGNILMSVSELFNYLIENNESNTINITYNSDYKSINIAFQPVDNQLVNKISNKIGFDHVLENDENKDLFLIHSLVDNINLIDEQTLSLEFDISALHNEIYKQRSALLKIYFSKKSVEEKVSNHND